MSKSRTIALVAACAITVSGLSLAGLAYAAGRARDHVIAKKITRALERAGVPEQRIQQILAQANQHRPELLGMWRQHKQDIGALASMSPRDAAQVKQKVQAMLDAHETHRDRLHGIVEQLGSSLAAREKAQLVLNLADRFDGIGGECGSRLDNVLDRLEDSEAFRPAELQMIQAQAEAVMPEMCNLRAELKNSVQDLRKAIGEPSTPDADLQAILARMKQNRHTAAQTRNTAIKQVIAQLSPQTQIQVAEKLMRLHRAAELLVSL